jgi:hypothetical protein
MIASPNTATLPVLLWNIMVGSGSVQGMYAVALIQIALVAVVSAVVWLVVGGILWLLAARAHREAGTAAVRAKNG